MTTDPPPRAPKPQVVLHRELNPIHGPFNAPTSGEPRLQTIPKCTASGALSNGLTPSASHGTLAWKSKILSHHPRPRMPILIPLPQPRKIACNGVPPPIKQHNPPQNSRAPQTNRTQQLPLGQTPKVQCLRRPSGRRPTLPSLATRLERSECPSLQYI